MILIGHHDRERIDRLRQAAAKKSRVVRTRETGARHSRAAHQSGDACGSAMGRTLLKTVRAYTLQCV
jgi:hypothetical protein